MTTLETVLLVFHFFGLTLGFATSFANMVMGTVMTSASPDERPVLARFPPRMSILGKTGVLLLWITGVGLVYTRYGGTWSMGWQFSSKIAAVILLTLAVGCITVLEGKIKKGDVRAAAMIQTVGKIAGMFAVLALVFAVLAFD